MISILAVQNQYQFTKIPIFLVQRKKYPDSFQLTVNVPYVKSTTGCTLELKNAV